MKKLLAFGLLFSLSACATMTDGTEQTILIQSNVSGATCTVYRNKEVIADNVKTPSIIKVTKTKYDIEVRCTKEGYAMGLGLAPSTKLGSNASRYNGLIGMGIDSMSGAINQYPSEIMVIMNKKED